MSTATRRVHAQLACLDALCFPKGIKIAGFCKKVTGITDPSATFHMASGFHRGQF